MTDPAGAADAAAAAALTSWGRLLAILAAPTRDLALAEDALADAFEQALVHWPRDGVPRNPEGWLLTVARNRQIDELRSARRRTGVPLDDAAERKAEDPEPDDVPDRLLALLFVCAHPAIDPGVRTPLMLQTVLHVDARVIATAFAVPAAAMAQRLVRAKRRIRDAGIAFEVPDPTRRAERLPYVLEAVYGAYAIGRQGVQAGRATDDLRGESLHLARLLAELMGDEPEVLGLAALVSLAAARDDATEAYVPLDDQDPARWDRDLIARGEAYLRRASGFGQIGRFQLEAAIQSVHDARALTGSTDREALLSLYGALVRVAPTLGALVGHALAVAQVEGPEAGLLLLDEVPGDRFQPAWAARAALLAQAGRADEARPAFDRAIELTEDPAVREHLRQRRDGARGT